LSPIRFLVAGALASAIALPTAAFAQTAPGVPPPGPGVTNPAGPGAQFGARRHHRNHFMHALRSLNLSDAQRSQIRDLIRQTRVANQNADPQTRRANMVAMRQHLDALLTPDQRTRLHAALQRRHRQGAHHGQFQPGTQPGMQQQPGDQTPPNIP